MYSGSFYVLKINNIEIHKRMCVCLYAHTYTVSAVISEGRIVFPGVGLPERLPWVTENEKFRASLSPGSAPPVGLAMTACLSARLIEQQLKVRLPSGALGPALPTQARICLSSL